MGVPEVESKGANEHVYVEYPGTDAHSDNKLEVIEESAA